MRVGMLKGLPHRVTRGRSDDEQALPGSERDYAGDPCPFPALFTRADDAARELTAGRLVRQVERDLGRTLRGPSPSSEPRGVLVRGDRRGHPSRCRLGCISPAVREMDLELGAGSNLG